MYPSIIGWNYLSKICRYAPVRNIRLYNHFEATETEPGIVSHKVNLEAVCLQTRVISSAITNSLCPAVLSPPDLSLTFKEYLYSTIRPYVIANCKDVLCPSPL